MSAWTLLVITSVLIFGIAFADIQIVSATKGDEDLDLEFPEDFQFGCASASFQVEGAWNESGKGENIWDRLTHTQPELVTDHSNADITCDSYHLYKEDVAILKDIGAQFYRFSISWPRVLPTGDVSNVNEIGIQYYSNLVDELLKHGIQPMITLFHWDLPQALQDLGGFTNPLIVEYFGDYARLMFERLGDRVKTWITVNEPTEQCLNGYVNMEAPPRVDGHGVGEYLCGHHVLFSHATAYHIYDREFRAKQGGRIGITLVHHWLYPKTDAAKDREAAERGLQFMLGWYAHPIFTKEGNYPKDMIEYIGEVSKREGRKKSRLPFMNADTINFIRGTADFLGLNHYTSLIASDGTTSKPPNWNTDQRVNLEADPSWPSSASSWLKVVPEGFRELLIWIRDAYPSTEVVITENGYSDHGQLNDQDRIHYICSYMNEMLKAIVLDECNVKGYAVWSILDNFEWIHGYTERFGIYYVNMSDPKRTRIPKESSRIFKEIVRSRRIPRACLNDYKYSYH